MKRRYEMDAYQVVLSKITNAARLGLMQLRNLLHLAESMYVHVNSNVIRTLQAVQVPSTKYMHLRKPLYSIVLQCKSEDIYNHSSDQHTFGINM